MIQLGMSRPRLDTPVLGPSSLVMTTRRGEPAGIFAIQIGGLTMCVPSGLNAALHTLVFITYCTTGTNRRQVAILAMALSSAAGSLTTKARPMRTSLTCRSATVGCSGCPACASWAPACCSLGCSLDRSPCRPGDPSPAWLVVVQAANRHETRSVPLGAHRDLRRGSGLICWSYRGLRRCAGGASDCCRRSPGRVSDRAGHVDPAAGHVQSAAGHARARPVFARGDSAASTTRSPAAWPGGRRAPWTCCHEQTKAASSGFHALVFITYRTTGTHRRQVAVLAMPRSSSSRPPRGVSSGHAARHVHWTRRNPSLGPERCECRNEVTAHRW